MIQQRRMDQCRIMTSAIAAGRLKEGGSMMLMQLVHLLVTLPQEVLTSRQFGRRAVEITRHNAGNSCCRGPLPGHLE